MECCICNSEKSNLSSLLDGEQCCRECRDKVMPLLFKGVPSYKEVKDAMAFLRFTDKSIEALFTYARKSATYLHEPYDVVLQRIIQELKDLSVFVLKKELFTLNIREHHHILSMYMSKEVNSPLYDAIIDTTMTDNLVLMHEKAKYVNKFMSWKLVSFGY